MNTLKKIYHVADIHLRNLKRHDEYRIVFNKMFDEIRSRGVENSLIYLGGDIAHAKLEMSPELIREMSWLFTECSKLCPTILITGNHDCNMNNLDRVDVLTPVVDALNLSNFWYLRDTQVWSYGGVGFSVFSIFDTPDMWFGADSPKLQAFDKKIALFHGPINSAMTDIGYRVENRDYTTNLFDGFDAALCGDIHKRQELLSPSGCKVVYCGSLVQQNYGETVDGHGFLVWDVDSMTYESVDIQNDYGYYTIDIDNGVGVYPADIPATARVRIRVSNTEESVIKSIVYDVRQKYSVKDITVLPVNQVSSSSNTGLENKIDNNDLNDIDVQNKILTEYLKKICQDITDDELADIIKLNVDLNSRVVSDDIGKQILWKPVSFKFSNMFSYGPDNEIDFEKIGGLNGIFAPNSSGKSSIFDSISFCLFDKCSRTSKPINVLNNSAKDFSSELIFQTQTGTYRIHRYAKLNKKGDSIRVDVDFQKLNADGTITVLNGDDRRVTNKVIEQYVGTYDDFVLTAFSVQGNNAMFIEKTQTERKELLAKFMGLNIYDSLYSLAYDEIYDVASLMKTFKKVDYTAELLAKENEFSKNRESFIQLEADEKEQLGLKAELDERILQLTSQLSPIKFVGDIRTLNSNREVLSNKIQKKRENLIDTTELLNGYNRLLPELKNKLEILKYNNQYGTDIEILVKELNDDRIKKRNIQIDIDKLNIALNSNIDKLRHLDSHEYDPNCQFCMNNVFVKDAIKTKEIVQEQRSQLTELESSLDEINSRITDLSAIVDTVYNEYIDVQNEIRSIEANISNSESNIKLFTAELNGFITSLNGVEADIEKYNQNEQTILDNSRINTEILSLKQSITGIELKLKGIKANLQNIISDTGSIKTFIQVTKEKIENVKNLERKHKLYSMYLNAVNKDGIPYNLISKTLPIINTEINNILSQVVDFNVILETDGKNINTRIMYDDRDWPLEMSCGMEKFISGLAIRTALINVCNLPRPNFLLIDEGMGSLDSDNLSSLYMLFDYLKSQFDFILLISHVDSIRDIVDGLLEIKKIDGISSINHV